MPMPAAERAKRIEQYERGPERLRRALAAVPDEAVKWRPAPGKWSVHEIVCHCADSEVNAYARLRYVLAEKDPLVVGYDQDEWARVFDYHALPIAPALATVDAVRASTADLLKRLKDEAWAKKGRHTEKDSYGSDEWLKIYADHVDGHARQIERNVEAWNAAGQPRAV